MSFATTQAISQPPELLQFFTHIPILSFPKSNQDSRQKRPMGSELFHMPHSQPFSTIQLLCTPFPCINLPDSPTFTLSLRSLPQSLCFSEILPKLLAIMTNFCLLPFPVLQVTQKPSLKPLHNQQDSFSLSFK